MLCNFAAAEFLMPVCSFPELKGEESSIDKLLELRNQFQVSTEAILLRFVRLTSTPCAIFAASRFESGPHVDKYKLDYCIGSRSWSTLPGAGSLLPSTSVIRECTAIGFTAKRDETWSDIEHPIHVESVGIPAYPGNRFPRVVGLLLPKSNVSATVKQIVFIKGDATCPRGTGKRYLAHVVNDKTPNWGAGFGLAVRKRWPIVQERFREWATRNPDQFDLGHTFSTSLDNGLTVFQMIAQHGYGPSPTARLRYVALKQCLEKLANNALSNGAELHMPRIGAGYGGGTWPLIEQLIDETLCSKNLNVTIYDLPEGLQSQSKQEPNLFG